MLGFHEVESVCAVTTVPFKPRVRAQEEEFQRGHGLSERPRRVTKVILYLTYTGAAGIT